MFSVNESILYLPMRVNALQCAPPEDWSTLHGPDVTLQSTYVTRRLEHAANLNSICFKKADVSGSRLAFKITHFVYVII